MFARESRVSHNELDFLQKALLFFHVEELRDVAEKLDLRIKGNKKALIDGILLFLQTGQLRKAIEIPTASRVRHGHIVPLHPQSLMLKGSYKNDLATRNFFKKLIGEHFHFTAFGIDWLNERWMASNPPTYQEFARMWQEEYEYRKYHKRAPKEEWAYINFTQNYLAHTPGATKQEVLSQWQKVRQQKVEHAMIIIRRIMLKGRV